MFYLILHQTKDLGHCFAHSRDSGCICKTERGKEGKDREIKPYYNKDCTMKSISFQIT